MYWKPVWHILESVCKLVLANSAHVRNVPGRKTDVNDAMRIADLLAHGLVRRSFVLPTPILELRDLTRTRKQLVREVSQHTLRIQKVLEDANIKITGLISDLLGLSGRAILAVAASMMVVIYPMLRDGVDYQDLGGDHFDRRDRDKIAQRLIRRLEELGLEVKVEPAAA